MGYKSVTTNKDYSVNHDGILNYFESIKLDGICHCPNPKKNIFIDGYKKKHKYCKLCAGKIEK